MPTTSAPGSLFGAPPATASSSALALTGSKPATAPPGGLRFGGSAPSSSTAPAATLSAPAPSQLKGQTLDEIVNKWSAELEDRTQDFDDIAGDVREWDRILRENGEQVPSFLCAVLLYTGLTGLGPSSPQISALYNSVLPLPDLQRNITSQLDFVEAHQADLGNMLTAYEAEMDGLVELATTSAGRRGNSGNAEKERERACVSPFPSRAVSRLPDTHAYDLCTGTR